MVERLKGDDVGLFCGRQMRKRVDDYRHDYGMVKKLVIEVQYLKWHNMLRVVYNLK